MVLTSKDGSKPTSSQLEQIEKLEKSHKNNDSAKVRDELSELDALIDEFE